MPPFDWKTFLVLAQLLSKMPEEAALRSAVSRAYYSAYIIALRRAQLQGYISKSDELGGSHDQLWDLYDRNQQDQNCVEIANIGRRMKRRRTGADYRDFFSNRCASIA